MDRQLHGGCNETSDGELNGTAVWINTVVDALKDWTRHGLAQMLSIFLIGHFCRDARLDMPEFIYTECFEGRSHRPLLGDPVANSFEARQRVEMGRDGDRTIIDETQCLDPFDKRPDIDSEGSCYMTGRSNPARPKDHTPALLAPDFGGAAEACARIHAVNQHLFLHEASPALLGAHDTSFLQACDRAPDRVPVCAEVRRKCGFRWKFLSGSEPSLADAFFQLDEYLAPERQHIVGISHFASRAASTRFARRFPLFPLISYGSSQKNERLKK